MAKRQMFELREYVIRIFAEDCALAIKLWQPRLCGESTRPGTANTCRLLSAAILAVISEPLFRSATTTVPSVIPATMRLRIGKLCLSPFRLKGNWVSNGAVLRDAFLQLRIFRHNVDAGAEHGEGSPLGRESSLMRGVVDTACAAADHRDACASKLVREFAGGILPVVGCPVRAHNRDAVVTLGQQAALRVKHDGRS